MSLKDKYRGKNYSSLIEVRDKADLDSLVDIPVLVVYDDGFSGKTLFGIFSSYNQNGLCLLDTFVITAALKINIGSDRPYLYDFLIDHQSHLKDKNKLFSSTTYNIPEFGNKSITLYKAIK